MQTEAKKTQILVFQVFEANFRVELSCNNNNNNNNNNINNNNNSNNNKKISLLISRQLTMFPDN